MLAGVASDESGEDADPPVTVRITNQGTDPVSFNNGALGAMPSPGESLLVNRSFETVPKDGSCGTPFEDDPRSTPVTVH